MPRRRAPGEGTIFQRRDGRWVASVRLPNGRRAHGYGRTEGEARDKLRSLQRRVETGGRFSRLTVAQLADLWLSTKSDVRERTVEGYEQSIRVHVIPEFGRLRVERVSPTHVLDFYKRLSTERAASTVRHVHVVLRGMFDLAGREGYVNRNPVQFIRPPRAQSMTDEMQTLTADQVDRLFTAANGTRLEAYWRLSIGNGLRAGEMLGLRWPEVNLDSAEIDIRHDLHHLPGGQWRLDELKRSRQRRTVGISASVADALRRLRSMQIEERLAAGPKWQDHGFVFTQPDGRPYLDHSMGPNYLHPLLERAGLPKVRPHDLRHTFATLALSAGVPITEVSQALGHASPGITMNIYAHALPGASRRAADAVESVLAAVNVAVKK